MELARLIQDLRLELQESIATAEGETLRFELGPIDLQLSVVVESGATAGAKARFWVMDASTEGRIDRSSTQQIKLTLTPRASAGGGSPLVSGTAVLTER